MSKDTLEILTHDEVIAVNQDPLGVQGRRVWDRGPQEVWVKPLADGSRAVILFNRGTEPSTITAHWEDVGLFPEDTARVRDLWNRSDVGEFTGSYETKVEPHGVAMVRVTPTF
jgi:alpha-galactosidase